MTIEFSQRSSEKDAKLHRSQVWVGNSLETAQATKNS